MRAFRFAALTVALVANGCGDSTIDPSDMLGGTWRLVSFQEGTSEPIATADPSRYTLSLGADGRIAVMSDCNSCGGPYTLSNGSLSAGPIACTRAFCGDASLDPRFPAALERVQSVDFDDDELTIMGGQVTLRFRR